MATSSERTENLNMPKPKPADPDLERLRDARDRDYLLHVTLYCENSGCPTRTFTVFFKDYDRTLLDTVQRRGFTCPLCGGSKVTLHYVQTSAQQAAADELEARES